MSTIYLIRHGMTEANERHLYCGATDLPLSEKGLAALQGKRIPVPEGAAFLTSGMKRTEQTLRALFGDVEHAAEPRFAEINFGRFEMHSYEELKDDPDYVNWITGDNEKNRTPGGESGEEMTARALEAFRKLPDRDTVIVTHGGIIAAIMVALFPGEGKNRYEWQPKPGCGYAVFPGGYRQIG